jgi:carbohydrate-selective porin OprB
VFLRGCQFNQHDQEFQRIVNDRTGQMKKDIRQFDELPWDTHYEITFTGVTLKHVLDHLMGYG